MNMSDLAFKNTNFSLLKMSFSMPLSQRQRFEKSFDRWKEKNLIAQLWAEDPSLWKGGAEEHMLGWLHAPEAEPAKLKAGLERLYQNSAQWENVVLLGMGGSALGAEALKSLLKQKENAPDLFVLDSLIPEDVASVSKKINLEKTLFIVSSKSGGTLESNTLFHFFWDKLSSVAEKERGKHFVAVTDPGTSLETLAKDHGFSEIFHGHPRIGGRYSIFSAFGLVPAAAAGYALDDVLAGAVEMMKACSPAAEASENPGLFLGLALGTACHEGRDKLIFNAAEKIKAFGPWLEQLVAESTGKLGTGIFPVLPEGKGALKGADRIVVYADCDGGKDEPSASVFLKPENIRQIGQMFYLWEFAIAVAGAEMEINPFDQPNVESSKQQSRALAKIYRETGKIPEIKSFEKEGILTLSSPQAEEFKAEKGLTQVLKKVFGTLKTGDYLALLFWTGRAADGKGHEIAHLLQQKLEVPVMLEMGPRFLHSTGQAYKGGKNTGLFLQVTLKKTGFESSALEELAVLSATQEQGDYQTLSNDKRRVLRIEIEDNLDEGLKTLEKHIKDALNQL